MTFVVLLRVAKELREKVTENVLRTKTRSAKTGVQNEAIDKLHAASTAQ